MFKAKTSLLAGLVLLIFIAAIAATWHLAQGQLRARDLQELLQPIASRLEEDRKILDDLAPGRGASDAALLEAYLGAIRKDGVPKHADTKQAIDALTDNNAAIVTLLAGYAPRASTENFKAAAETFRVYATSFRERWQSVFETFMAGGNLPAAGPAFPTTFAAAVAAEESALR